MKSSKAGELDIESTGRDLGAREGRAPRH